MWRRSNSLGLFVLMDRVQLRSWLSFYRVQSMSVSLSVSVSVSVSLSLSVSVCHPTIKYPTITVSVISVVSVRVGKQTIDNIDNNFPSGFNQPPAHRFLEPRNPEEWRSSSSKSTQAKARSQPSQQQAKPQHPLITPSSLRRNSYLSYRI